MFDWNDVKLLLAVGRHGSAVTAARTLGVRQSTVQRRLSELEWRLGLRLVERLPVGYRLTPIGRSLLPAADFILSNRGALAPILTGGSIPERGDAEAMPLASVDPTPTAPFLTVP